MAFEPIYEVVALDCKKKLCSSQIVVEARLIPPPNVAIARILGISGDVSVATTEVFSQEARVSGRVNFKVLYLTEDNETQSMDYNADFSDKLNDESIESGRPLITAKILDTDIIGLSAGEIKLASVVEMELFDSRAVRTKYLTKGSENIYTHDERLEYTSLVASVDDTFVAEAEEAFDCDRVLSYDTAVYVKRFEAEADCVKTEGELVARVIGYGEGGIRSFELVCPFINESRAEGARGGCIVDGTVKLRSVELVAEEGKIKACFKSEIKGFVYAEQATDAVSDAFSVACELNKECSVIEYKISKGCFSVIDEIDGSVTLDNNMPIADTVLAASGTSLSITNAYATEGRAVIEGIMNTNLVYYSSEANAVSSVKVELPFSIAKAAPVKEGDELFACGSVTRVSYKVRRGNELTVKADVCALISASESRKAEIITGLTEGEEIPVPTSAISLHIARPKETLWEVAKALCTTPELVLVQNPNLTLPLSGGERIVAYRHLKK